MNKEKYEKAIEKILKLCKDKRDFGIKKYKEEAFQNKDQSLKYCYRMLIQEHIDMINYNLEIIRQLQEKEMMLNEN